MGLSLSSRFFTLLWVLVAFSSSAFASQTTPLFVLNSLDANVSVINPVTWEEIRRIPTGKEPHHLYLTPDERSIIIANALSDTLTFIDPRTAEVQRTVRDIVDPYHLRFTPDMKWLVTAANRLNHVDFYKWDGKELTLAKRVATSRTPSHIWIDSKSTTAYVHPFQGVVPAPAAVTFAPQRENCGCGKKSWRGLRAMRR